MTITTFDCKIFLTKQFPELEYKGWKRVRKFKNDSKEVCREFQNDDFSIVIVERNNILEIESNSVVSPPKKIPFEVVFQYWTMRTAKKLNT